MLAAALSNVSTGHAAFGIVAPPDTCALAWTKIRLSSVKSYLEWFMKVMPARLTELRAEVHESALGASWRGDCSPESLDLLGVWFEGEVQVVPRRSDEIDKVKSRLSFPIEVPREELTIRTFSLAMDIGMYFSQVVLNNLNGTRWEQPLKNNKFADYGQPVLMGFGTVPLNPVRILVSTAYSIAKGKEAQLRHLYDVWAKMKH